MPAAFLDQAAIHSLLAAPGRSTWTGRRDHALFPLATQTGLGTSELTGLNCGDVHLATVAHVTCQGKGHKQQIMDGWLTLKGEIKRQSESNAAFETVSQIPGVGGITNKITVITTGIGG